MPTRHTEVQLHACGLQELISIIWSGSGTALRKLWWIGCSSFLTVLRDVRRQCCLSTTFRLFNVPAVEDDDPRTVKVVVATLEILEHRHSLACRRRTVHTCNGEVSCCSLRTSPRRGPLKSHQSQGPVEACSGVYRGTFGANNLQLKANVGCKISLRHRR